MSLCQAIIIAVFLVSLIAYLQITCRYSKQVRESLRPHAERLIIEKRWIERAAASREPFEQEWARELRALYPRHVPVLARRVFSLADFERALNAEFACITNQEIASWTYADRVSETAEDFEKVVARCFERFGWLVMGGRRLRGTGADLLLTIDRRQVAVRCHHGRNDVECRGVMEIAYAARTLGIETGCIITNGRFSGSTRALADQFGVILLHCSQLDLLSDAVREARVAGAAWHVEERLAA